MIRFFFRLLSVVSLAIAVVMSVLDATRSIAASEIVLTPLATSWAANFPAALAATRAFVEQKVAPELWALAVEPVLALPGFAVFAGAALLFYMVGRRPERRSNRFVAEA